MEGLAGWAISLCTVALGCTAVQMLAPKGGMGRLLHMILAAFFLCCLIKPLLTVPELPTLTFPEISVTDEVLAREQFRELLQKETDRVLEKRITALLASYHVAVERVETDMNISADGAIYMRRILVYLNEQNIAQATTVYAILKQQLDIPVTVRAA